MINFFKSFKISLFFILLFLNFNVLNKAHCAPVENGETFETWKIHFKKEAMQTGISEKFILSILPKLKFLPHVIESDKKQNEFLLTFWAYTDKVLTQKRIQEGKENSIKYKKLLEKISQKYGIHQKYILAFWGLETNYGTYKGDIPTLSALATLSYDKRRRAFFTNELITLLKLIEKGETTNFKGSWAGAFGNFQFMPTTYAAYAVDEDNDGKRDIIYSLPDAFASAANYLSKMGWKSNQLWGREVRFTKAVDWADIPENSRLKVSEWKKRGVLPACGDEYTPVELEETAQLVLPSGIEGPAFLTYRNYDFMTRWNNSSLYAISIGILAEKIQRDEFKLCSPRKEIKISLNDIRFIQQKLKEKGFYTSTVDGILGKNTKKAIRAYQKESHLAVDGFPSEILMQALKRK